MISPAVKFCLANLLSQSPEVKMNEIDVLMSDQIARTQLAQCVRSYGSEASAKKSKITDNNFEITAQGSGTGTQPKREL